MGPDIALFRDAVPVVLAFYLLGAGITLFAAIQSALIAVHGYHRRLYASFSLTCCCMAVFQITSVCLYAAPSLAFVDIFFRLQIVAISLCMIPFTAFVALYTGQALTKRQFVASAAIFGVMAVSASFSAYGMRFSTLEFSAPLAMPWGEKLNRFSGAIDARGWLLRCIYLAAILWAIWRTLAWFRNGKPRCAVSLAVCILLFIFAYVWGILIDLRIISSLYLAGFAYLGFVLLMSFNLSLDVYDHSRRLISTIALLQKSESGLRESELRLQRINAIQRQFIETDYALGNFDFLLQQLLEATDSEIGLVGRVLYNPDGRPYVKTCAVSNIARDEQSRRLYEKNKGQSLEFRNMEGLFGAVVNGEIVIANNTVADPRAIGTPLGHAAVSSYLGVPVFKGETVIGIIGLGNRLGGYDAAVIEVLEQYLTTCATMIEACNNKQISGAAEAELVLHTNVFENAWEGIIITDAQCRMVSVNESVVQMTGYPRDELLGQNPKIFSSGKQDAAFYNSMWETISSTGHWRGEIWNRKKNGELYAEILTISVIKNIQGEVSNYIGIFADVTELKNTQQRLNYLAHYDPLTGLPNRMLLIDRLQQSIAQAKNNGTLLGVCCMDLDGFKPVNDKYGHEIGDRLLAAVAERLSSVLRSWDTLSRLGGDEFVVLLANSAGMEEIGSAMAQLLEAVSAPFIIEKHTLHISASLGLTVYPYDNADSETLLRHADAAMYEAKQTGRNRFHLFDAGLDQQVQARHQMLRRLWDALQHDEFCLFYQPKLNLSSKELIGMEALLRWQHPERGLLSPAEFLPLAESTDLIIAIGDWVLDNVLAQIQRWRQQGLEIQVSVNIAARQLQHPDFLSCLESVLAKYPDVPSHLLELEILETAALETNECARVVKSAYKQLGVSFALDDFGTGYASLSYLKRLPVKMLKIDQSFVRDLLEDQESQAVISGIVQLAKAFRRRVIAEGVETELHADKLLEIGCELAQGYGIAPPMTVAAAEDWIKVHCCVDEPVAVQQ